MENHPLRYSLRQLRYFVVTAETLSFTAAAKRLHISQPSISTALADLESSFGVQLFIRHHASGLSLTQAGRDLLGQARNLLKIAEELQTSAKEMDGGMTGSIALGCLVSPLRYNAMQTHRVRLEAWDARYRAAGLTAPATITINPAPAR